jgi:hypothetical protein
MPRPYKCPTFKSLRELEHWWEFGIGVTWRERAALVNRVCDVVAICGASWTPTEIGQLRFRQLPLSLRKDLLA